MTSDRITDTRCGLDALRLDAAAALLGAYVAELDRWDRGYGFVKANPEQLVTHHVLDALAAVPVVRRLGPAVADNVSTH